MAAHIPLSRAYHSEKIDRRILEVVKQGNFILGPECKAFEAELAAYLGVKHVVLSSSWTAAVHLLHIAQRMKPGDEVLVPSLTAFPTIEPLIHAGGRPVFVDVDESYTMDPADAAAKITSRTVGMIPVHLYGRPADLDALVPLAKKHGLWVLEDCAQSIGASHRGRQTGSIGEFGAYSFYPSKNLTVYGDGGAIATNDDALAARVGMLRNHGRRDKYVHEAVGYNLRFNEIQAAIGREQLLVIDQLNGARRRVAGWYREELAGTPGLTLPPEDRDGLEQSVHHMYVVRLGDPDTRDALGRHLKAAGIETGVHYPVANHLQPAITAMYGELPALPRTEAWVKRILSLPMYPALTQRDVETVAGAIRAFLKK